MAYRFLLEVPESLAAEANIAVTEAGDAQVLVARPSTRRSFDASYTDLTVAAHTLRVIDTLYDWFDDLGASRPDIAIVLHSGERVTLEALDRGAMVAAIRRDQPWVERTIPKIGDHETEGQTTGYTEGAGLRADRAIDAAGGNAPGAAAATLDASWIAPAATLEREPERRIAIRELNHIALAVTDLAKAERFYTDFLAMDLVGRARRGPTGSYRAVDGDYTWDEATLKGVEADVAFLQNGPLTIALQRLGRGARLERGLLDHISIRVDATTYATLKGEVLVRSFEVLQAAETAFAFRDPFGIVWEITLQGFPGYED